MEYNTPRSQWNREKNSNPTHASEQERIMQMIHQLEQQVVQLRSLLGITPSLLDTKQQQQQFSSPSNIYDSSQFRLEARKNIDDMMIQNCNTLPIVRKDILVGKRGARYYINNKGKPVYLKEYQRRQCDVGMLKGSLYNPPESCRHCGDF